LKRKGDAWRTSRPSR